jgi:hypothetical protein
MQEVGFNQPGVALHVRSPFWPEWNGLDWRNSVSACLEWLGMAEVIFAKGTKKEKRTGKKT